MSYLKVLFASLVNAAAFLPFVRDVRELELNGQLISEDDYY